MGLPKRKLVFQPQVSRGHVGFRGGMGEGKCLFLETLGSLVSHMGEMAENSHHWMVCFPHEVGLQNMIINFWEGLKLAS